VAYSVLKNAGITSREVDLLNEIAELKQVLAAVREEKKKLEIEKQIREKQLEFNLLMERQKKEKRSKK
jgi:D-alanine-D-alanine ligase-like ATP-grasp enzyme